MIITLKKQEPEALRRGKKFHKQMQDRWRKTAEGIISSEKSIIKPSGGKGRIDVFVKDENKNDNLVAVIELKASDWDSMTDKAIRRNARRYVKQILNYNDSKENLVKAVSPGIIFQKSPKDLNRKELIEGIFNDNLITVVWDDDSK
jgi:hypothetical protein